jgi:drug/metabolite transporter (DMT)-like permease
MACWYPAWRAACEGARCRHAAEGKGDPEEVNLRTLKDDALLLLTAAIWGFAFVAQRVGMEFVRPFTYNGIRFALGALSLLPLVLLRRSGRAAPDSRVSPHPAATRGRLFLYGLVAGSVLFIAATLQQIGIVTTTAGKAGFITGLYVVLVPISGLFWRQKAGWGRWLGAALAVSGLYLLSVTGRFAVARGDLLVLASAVFWTAHVQLIGWVSPRVDSLELAALQFAVCSLLSLAAALLTESVPLEGILAAAVPILYGGLGSVGIAYTLQVVVQKTAHPAHVAILLSLEGVFAVLGGWLILAESLSARGLTGCLLMLAGMLASQSTLLGNPAGTPGGVPAGATRPEGRETAPEGRET